MKSFSLATIAVLSLVFAPVSSPNEAQADTKAPTSADASKTLSAIHAAVKKAGQKKLFKSACGSPKKRSKSPLFAEIHAQSKGQYATGVVLWLDRGGQLHVVDATSSKRRPVRTLLGSKAVKRFAISAKAVEKSLRSKPTCAVGQRQDLDL